jgi:transcriptional regulator with XRE-family HTH domain
VARTKAVKHQNRGGVDRHAASFLLAQIRQAVAARGLLPAEFARALGVQEATLTAWLTGRVLPPLSTLERMFVLLRLAPVFVHVEERGRGTSLADYLDEVEADLYERLDADPRTAMADCLKDLRLQRIRLEQDRLHGYISEREYRKNVLALIDQTRWVSETVAKLEISGRFGAGDVADVTFEYGSPAGPSYDAEKVERVRERAALPPGKEEPDEEPEA